MSRRKQNDAGGGLVLALMLIVALGVFLLRLLATFALFTAPLILFAAWLKLAKVKNQAPEIEDPLRFDDMQAEHAVSGLLGQIAGLRSNLSGYYETGSQHDLYLTKGSDETRFDGRSVIGRRLNEAIEHTENEIASLEAEIRLIRQSVQRKFPNWSGETVKWTSEVAKERAFKDAVIASLFSCVVCYSWGLTNVAQALDLQRMLLWNPIPNIMIIPVLGAVPVAYAFFWLRISPREKQAWAEIDGGKVASWYKTQEKWDPYNNPADYFAFEQLTVGIENPRFGEKTSDADRCWWEVLGVRPDASLQDVVAAYRSAMKAYHPDRVADVGSKLQEVANRESQAINAAFEQGKRVSASQAH